MRQWHKILGSLSLAAVSTLAQAKTVGGVKMSDTMEVAGKPLKLNGMAVRKKFIISVYVGGLYTVAPAHTEAEAVDPDEPKVLLMHFVHDVDAAKLKEAFKEGFANNSKDSSPADKAAKDKFVSMVPGVKEGDEIKFVYEPGKGSTLTLPGGKSETFAGKAFGDAFLQVFVGKDPPTGDLKAGLLGK